MSRAQRLVFLGIAVVIAIVAIVVLADSSEDPATPADNADATATATPTEEAAAADTPTPTPTATPKPQPPLLDGSEVVKLEFTEGDTVRFRVKSDVAEEVHVHGYNIARDLEPGQATTMSFPASITGIFEIEYEHAKQQIAELRVNPK
jgi:heme/copper-type cytochrome/quinol oxidase subunit 2